MIKSGIHINGIYQHSKSKEFYKAIDVGYHHETGEGSVMYYKCDENGMYKSIRDENDIVKVHQPFLRDLKSFKEEINMGLQVVPRFNFIKQCS